ncbi:hypothetical protein [Candidatus Spongiihabitans sp.]|uniref:hypothetical protein n=1 Tax=Candidatus Spongiihabitans sp. TaxID=3101308 RepID=UPI003C7A78BE
MINNCHAKRDIKTCSITLIRHRLPIHHYLPIRHCPANKGRHCPACSGQSSY